VTGGKALKVIVVDDVSLMRRVYADIVKAKGHEVVGEAATGREAVQSYKDLRPDMVIMDVVMPDATGLEAVKAIISFDPDAKIVIISAAEDESVLDDALALGARAVLRKPPDPDRLGELIDKISSEAKERDPVARMTAIYTSILHELRSFIKRYFTKEVDEALVHAVRTFVRKGTGLEVNDELSLKPVEGEHWDLHELNERLNDLLEAVRDALAPHHGANQAGELVREAFKLVYQHAEKEAEGLSIMFPPWLEAEVVRIERANWEANLDLMKKRYGLKGGHIFLVDEAEPKESYRIFSAFTLTGSPGMIISRTSPKEVQERYKTGPTAMIWLTFNKVQGFDCIEPTGGGLIYKRISEYVKAHDKAIILIDGLEYMISQTTFGGAQKFLQAIHDEVMLSSAIVIVPLDSAVLDQKQIHFLSRELMVVKPKELAPKARAKDGGR
jgi:two-component system chemotaxis response regulator CheY